MRHLLVAFVLLVPVLASAESRLLDREASCANRSDADVYASALTRMATDGCFMSKMSTSNDDVLDVRVLFDANRARVRHRGRAALAKIMTRWQASSQWEHLTIEGHADEPGSDEYNRWLSQLRAERTRDVLVKLGADPRAITAIGFGRTQPRAAGRSDTIRQRNRRVEFAFERSVPSPLATTSH